MIPDKNAYKRPAIYGLKTTKGFTQGKIFPLYQGQEHLIGKASDCHVTIESMNPDISYKHAKLWEENGLFYIENLSQTSQIRVGGKKNVASAEIKRWQRIEIGDHQFSLVPYESIFSAPDDNRLLRILLISGIGLILFTLFAVVFKDPEPDTKAVPNQQSESQEILKTGSDGYDIAKKSGPDKAPQIHVSPENIQKSEELYRQGLFHYESKNLQKAMGAWQQAIRFNPLHNSTRERLERTRKELDQLVDEYLKNADLQMRLMKHAEAKKLYKIITELIPEETDPRHVNAVRKLKTLNNR